MSSAEQIAVAAYGIIGAAAIVALMTWRSWAHRWDQFVDWWNRKGRPK